MEVKKCRSCGADIYWIKMQSGKFNPVDIKKQVIVTESGEIVSGYISHFSTCPQSMKWRKKDD